MEGVSHTPQSGRSDLDSSSSYVVAAPGGRPAPTGHQTLFRHTRHSSQLGSANRYRSPLRRHAQHDAPPPLGHTGPLTGHAVGNASAPTSAFTFTAVGNASAPTYAFTFTAVGNASAPTYVYPSSHEHRMRCWACPRPPLHASAHHDANAMLDMPSRSCTRQAP